MRRSVLLHAGGLLLLAGLLMGCRSSEPIVSSTAPPTPVSSRESDERLTLAFGSCAGENDPQPVWAAVLSARPDAFLFLGDNVYGDTEDMDTLRRAYAKLAAKPGFQRVRATMPVLAIWDDHDYGVNDGGAEYPMRDSSEAVFLDFFEAPPGDPRRSRPGIYTSYLFEEMGRRVHLILLDTRYFRGPLQRAEEDRGMHGPYVPNPDTSVTLLGDAQWTWLEEQLRLPADVRIVASSIQVLPEEHGWEKWANLPHERDRLLAMLAGSEADRIFLLSGDRHFGEISRLELDDGRPLVEVTSSGLTKAGWDASEEANRYRLGTPVTQDHFGLVRLDWQAGTATLELRAVSGEVLLEEAVPLAPAP